MSVTPKKLTLKAWFHPSMKLPFKTHAFTMRVAVAPRMQIVDLMDDVEGFFQDWSAKAGLPLDLQINVFWNTKDHNKALNPHDQLGNHFVDGESFGVYGDILPMGAQIPSKREEDKVPITILAGSGAGKTSLLNNIFQEHGGKNITIIEEDTGGASNLVDSIEVTPECTYCTLKGDLITSLVNVSHRVRKGGAIDAILIKMPACADPALVVRTLMSEPSLHRELRLDAIITLVDAKQFFGKSDAEVNAIHRQIALADKVFLSTWDMHTAERARSINRFAKVSSVAKAHKEGLVNLHAHNIQHFAKVDIETEAQDASAVAAMGGYTGLNRTEGRCEKGVVGGANVAWQGRHLKVEFVQEQRSNSFAIVREGEIIPKKLFEWMQSLNTLSTEHGTVLRIKAILAVQGHAFKRVFHAVMDVSQEEDAGPWLDNESKVCKVVFVGRSLDKNFFTRGFEHLFVD